MICKNNELKRKNIMRVSRVQFLYLFKQLFLPEGSIAPSFIIEMSNGYEALIGERGATLSGDNDSALRRIRGYLFLMKPLVFQYTNSYKNKNI